MYVTTPSLRSEIAPRKSRGNALHDHITRDVKAGAYLFRQHDRAERIYKITSGVLRLTRLTLAGRRQVIAFGYPGDIIGFPSNGTHTTDCDVLSDAVLASYPRRHLEGMDGDPELHMELLQAALREITEMQEHFIMLGRKTATEKIAAFLSVLSKRVGQPLGLFNQFSLPMSRADIADFLGLTTETVSRSLTQLRKGNVISIESIHTVIVLKPDALQALAESCE